MSNWRILKSVNKRESGAPVGVLAFLGTALVLLVVSMTF